MTIRTRSIPRSSFYLSPRRSMFASTPRMNTFSQSNREYWHSSLRQRNHAHSDSQQNAWMSTLGKWSGLVIIYSVWRLRSTLCLIHRLLSLQGAHMRLIISRATLEAHRFHLTKLMYCCFLAAFILCSWYLLRVLMVRGNCTSHRYTAWLALSRTFTKRWNSCPAEFSCRYGTLATWC